VKVLAGDVLGGGRADDVLVVPRKATARERAGATGGARPAAAAPDRTSEFFAELSGRGHEPLLEKVTGTARFDIADGGRTEHWHVAVERGTLNVSRRNARADATIRATREAFDRLAAGERNVLAAVMREEVAVDGDPRFLVRLQRLFPRPERPR
jgi:putative sterol carrier protein